MLSTPGDMAEPGLTELALLEAALTLAMKSLIATPESLIELAAECGACDGSREGAGRAPDMTHEAARWDPTSST